jgi:hypothetical protein
MLRLLPAVASKDVPEPALKIFRAVARLDDEALRINQVDRAGDVQRARPRTALPIEPRLVCMPRTAGGSWQCKLLKGRAQFIL